MDTLINAISSLIVVNGDKFIKLDSKDLRKLSYYLISAMSVVVFAISSKGYSVLFMFLFADLLCCAAVFPIFYSMYNKYVSKKLGFISVISGLVSGLLMFPNQTFEKSLLIGNFLPLSYFPTWVSTALLFWSFILATFIPFLIIIFFINKDKIFNFRILKNSIRKIR